MPNIIRMKQLYYILCFLIIGLSCYAQEQPVTVHYNIKANLNTTNKTIDGRWDAIYINRADSSLHAIWILLYPNAFASDRTHYCDELLQWGNTKYYFGKKEDRGWIDSLDFVVNEKHVMAKKTDNVDGEYLQLLLDSPLAPGDSVRISTTFFTQIPFNFQEDGYSQNDYILRAWCPLIADLSENGWNLKYYSAFKRNKVALADYTIELSYPKNYLVKSNGSQSGNSQYFYKGDEGFQWIASKNKDFVFQNDLNPKTDSLRSLVARRIFPSIFYSNCKPENPSLWLGQVYKRYNQPVPFLQDSLYYQKDSTIKNNRKLKLGFLYDLRKTDSLHYVFLSPRVGFNNYDKWMIGGLIHNYQLPQEPLTFAIAPMYATGSKKLSGWGRVGYNVWNRKTHWEFSISGSTFSTSDFDIPNYPKFYQRMWRIVPSIDVTIVDQASPATRKWDIGIRSFLLNQQNYSQFTNGKDTSYGNINYRTTLLRGNITWQDTRKLYPYSLQMLIDAGKEFIKFGLTGKYFFNYDATNRGVSARLFAGKFFYLKQQTSQVEYTNQVYNFGLSGASGNYDYTFSDYFIGRNEYQGWMSQQIMERDGFFKIPTTNMSGGPLGLTDNWLTAINLTADFPKNADPLKYIGGGLKFFFDVGTYSDLWSDVPPAGRFLYDAGLQISLFKSLVNVYVPIIYSKVYKDRLPYDKRFLKTISFNINLTALQPRNRSFLWPL